MVQEMTGNTPAAKLSMHVTLSLSPVQEWNRQAHELLGIEALPGVSRARSITFKTVILQLRKPL
jgi:hypothetical protein